MFRGWEQAPTASAGTGAGVTPWPDVARVADQVGVEHLLVTRHTLVRQVLNDPTTFRPDNALDAITPIPVAALRTLAAHRFRLPPTLANNGGAGHPAIRALVAEALHPTRVAAQRDWLTALIRQRVAELTATLATGAPVDLHAGLAADLPLLVLARLIDLPDAPVAAVKDFARAALELFWAPLDTSRQQMLAAEVGRFHLLLREFAATGDGLVASLRAAGHPPDVVVGALFFLLVAGQETTSQFLTLLMHRLVGEPAVLTGLRDGRVNVADVVEEGLRLEPPIVTWRRIAAVDTTLGGTSVTTGSSVVLWLARAGRDPQVVQSPDEFRPGQPGSRRHLAFGAGVHRCVGDQLARMEAATLVAEATTLLTGVRVVRPPHYPDNFTFRMPDTFVVRR
ncbi:cytochrome P450 [Micromonospora sp. HNM0581]|uniref:cytochrome P450 n=1 Tax=Micromonospora sp. HNM0581 TaxID=2716341 RepID=UPI00146F7438|nr:cytochrome P450 [Micromonospora sp. HNM0581]NLU80400.1 cytochrome P450 [Micromonospora sp. HNM0581]